MSPEHIQLYSLFSQAMERWFVMWWHTPAGTDKLDPDVSKLEGEQKICAQNFLDARHNWMEMDTQQEGT